MWVALLIFGAALFALAGLISPIMWFFAPAIALLALAIAIATGIIGAAQEAPDRTSPETADEGEPSGSQATGYAHSGQAPGHSA